MTNDEHQLAQPDSQASRPPHGSAVDTGDAILPQPDTQGGPPSSFLPDQPLGNDQATAIESEPRVQMTAELFASGSLPAGTMLGHFRIKSFIGGGGMGRVYLASDTALDRNVALKVLPRQRANDQPTVARFMNEARSAARLNHEHIAQVYFAGEQDGVPYIVFEYVEGTNIRTQVNEYDAFPLSQALNYLIQIAHALSHAAEHGVVHRDVKPSNILITREGRAKLIDMGLARLLDPDGAQDDLTASGVTLGTFDYISPEQARDPRNADIRSDIYSLGCTFFFMLSGRPPFPEGTVLQKLLQHQGDEPPDIRDFQSNIPVEVAALLQKMMAKDPKLRFQTPAVLIDALINIAKMIGLQPTGPGKLIWVMNPASKASQLLKHIPWISTVFLLLLVFFPLNLYWKHLGKLDMPPMPAGAEPATVPIREGTGSIPPITSSRTGTGSKESEVGKTFVWSSLPARQYDERWTRKFAPLSGSGGNQPQRDSGGAQSGGMTAARWDAGQKRLGGGLAAAALSVIWTSIAPCPEGARLDYSMFPAKGGGSVPQKSSEITVNAATSTLCVDPSGTTPGSYTTLTSAIVDAAKGATIELKWNGSMRVNPLGLIGRHLTLIPAEGYVPMLSFDPTDSTVFSPSSRSMITAQSSNLTFRDLAIEMVIRQDDMGLKWTLFELIGSNRLVFARCVLTISNASSDNSAYHQEVVFFRNNVLPVEFDHISLQPSPLPRSGSQPAFGASGGPFLYGETYYSGTMLTDPVSGWDNRLEVRLTDSILRGEATCLQCDVTQGIDFYADNSLIMLAKSFVQTEDSRKTVRPETSVRLFFDHITFFGRQAFARQLRSSFETEPMRLAIEANASIFFMNNVPLIDFRGARLMQDTFDSFRWTGKGNYFQNASLGVRLRPALSLSDGGVTYDMSLVEWLEKVDTSPEGSFRRTTGVDQLFFNEIRKPTHRLLTTDLIPNWADESMNYRDTQMPGIVRDRLVRPPASWNRE